MLLCLLALGIGFQGACGALVRRLNVQEEYSHGYLIVLVSAYFLWQERAESSALEFQPSWVGAVIVVVSAAVALRGESTALFLIIQYSLVAMLLGLALALMGWRGLHIVMVPILLPLLSIPQPYFIDSDLSGELRLLSPEL